MEAPPENFAYTLLLSPDFRCVVSRSLASAATEANASAAAIKMLLMCVLAPRERVLFSRYSHRARVP
jgi:hypothetical protein